MQSIKVIIVVIIIITAVLLWLFHSEETTPETLPKNNTIYVQSSLPGKCRAIISLY